jgi:hypothetical protein
MCPEVCSNPILEGAEKKIRCMIDELDEASNATRLVLCEVTGLKSLKDALKNSWRFMLVSKRSLEFAVKLEVN